MLILGVFKGWSLGDCFAKVHNWEQNTLAAHLGTKNGLIKSLFGSNFNKQKVKNAQK